VDSQISGIRFRQRHSHLRLQFKPWTGPADADRGEIAPTWRGLAENEPQRHFRSGTRISSESEVSSESQFRHRSVKARGGRPRTFTAHFLWMCQGYYRHSQGLLPGMAGHGCLQGPYRSPASAGDDSDTSVKRWCDRIGCERGAADSGERGCMRARHDAAALADLFFGPGRNATRNSPRRCGSCRVSGTWIHGAPCGERVCSIRTH